MDNELKEFWEACGLKQCKDSNTFWYPDEEKYDRAPDLTLDNLHKYAEKLLLEKGYVIDCESTKYHTTVMIYIDTYRNNMIAKEKCDDKKKALYEALKKALGVE
jgi:hypothetical protein